MAARKPKVIFATQAVLLLSLVVSLLQTAEDAQHVYSYATLAGLGKGHFVSVWGLFLAHFLFVGLIVLGLVGLARRAPWARWPALFILGYASLRLGLSLLVGFHSSPAHGPMPPTIHPEPASGTEAIVAALFTLGFLAGLLVLIYALVRSKFVADYLEVSREKGAAAQLTAGLPRP